MMTSELLAPSITAYRSGLPGPTLAIVGGVHGNERLGILAVERLGSLIQDGALVLQAGTLILAFGNPDAIARDTRRGEDGLDLNRCFKTATLTGQGSAYAEERARVLTQALGSAQCLVDLHGTLQPSQPFLLAQRRTPEIERLLSAFSAERAVIDPDLVFGGEPVTLDDWFVARGGAGICYETGSAGDVGGVDRVVGEIMDTLSLLGMTSSAAHVVSASRAWFRLVSAIPCTPAFAYLPGFGGENFQSVPKGGVFARNEDGEMISEHEAIILFPKKGDELRTGSPAGYLAVAE